MIGSIIPFTGTILPSGWLVCDGSTVSRTDYSELFSVIGTNFGSGDGVSTFNIPNLLNRVVIGNSLDHAFATSGGESSHVLTENEIAEHFHVVPSHGHTNDFEFSTPELSHSITSQPSFTYTKLNGTGNTASNTSQPAYTGTTNASMTRATNVAIADHPPTDCTMSGGITDCPAMTSSTTGGNGSHNNMMPYLALVYLIQTIPDPPPPPVIPSMVLYNGAMPVGPSGAYIAGRR